MAVHARQSGYASFVITRTRTLTPIPATRFDMPLMIHKIHMGEYLSEDYTIVGYRQSVHNYNDVVYPAPINECEACHTGGIPTGNFPMVSTPSAALVCDGFPRR